MNAIDKKKELFSEKGCNCAQAAFGAFEELTGISESDALKISMAFGSGFAGTRNLCGALTGIGMAAGCIVSGRFPEESPAEQRGRVYEIMRGLADRFQEKNGSMLCESLLASCDAAFGTPECREYCSALVSGAVALLEEALAGG